MQSTERDFLVRYLQDNERRILELTDHLTPRQQTFRLAPDEWSIADIVEHLAVVEARSLPRLEERLQQPQDTEKKSRLELDAVILNVVSARTRRAEASEASRPAGRWSSFGEALDEFRKARARSVHFAQTTKADLRAYLLPNSALGDLDVYQALLFLGSHAERHRKQAQEIKDDRAFPRR